MYERSRHIGRETWGAGLSILIGLKDETRHRGKEVVRILKAKHQYLHMHTSEQDTGHRCFPLNVRTHVSHRGSKLLDHTRAPEETKTLDTENLVEVGNTIYLSVIFWSLKCE